ncbi:MAG: dynamin family protein [Anaerolineae bacterium]|nr:dynamin family protein [Anaerolineae bacterium]
MESPVLTPVEGQLAALREREITALVEAAGTLVELGDTAGEDRKRLLDMAEDLRDLFFLVVVIGEFNAGKSTFINALLADELLAMGITPTTEAIHIIKHGDSGARKPNMRPDGLYEWRHPNTGAPGVALVDTPGTGSVFQKHEQTAKAFLHRSDLVIFVISAKRAFAETERLYLSIARDFGKKIILVVNQSDLLEPSERQQVRRFVEQQVEELLDIKPLIFMTSSKEALRAARAGESDQQGIEAVRAHLRGMFSEAPPARQKLLAQLSTAERIVNRHYEAVKGNADLVGVDKNRLEDIQREIDQQSNGLSGQLSAARAQIDSVFESMRLRGLNFITKNLSIRNMARPSSREALQTQFQDEVVGRALRDVSEATDSYVNALVDSSRAYWRDVIDRLNQLQRLLDQELSGLDAGIYAEQREALQEAIRIADAELKSYSTGKVIAGIQETFRTNLNGFALGGGAAVVGLIITLLGVGAPGPLIGVGAAVLALPAVLVGAPITLVGGVVAVRYLRRVSEDSKRELNGKIDALLVTYHQALDDLTRKERNRLSQYGAQVLAPIFSRLRVLNERYQTQMDRVSNHRTTLETLRREIDTAT